MKKWFLKNKNEILKAVIVAIIAGIIFKLVEIIPNSIISHKNIVINYLSKILEFSITIRIYHVVSFIILWIIVSWLYRKIKNRNKKLKIIEAKYFTDSHSLNITNNLNDAIENNELKIVLSNNIAGDPHKGIIKKGKIKYKFNGQKAEKEYKEGDLIELP